MLFEGYVMNVDNLNPNAMRITLQKSASLSYDTVSVSVTCRGRVYAVEAFGLGAEPYTFSISKEKFPAGCLQITAFNTNGDILAERLAFHTKPNMYIPIKVTQDKPRYKPFEEINMEFDIHDHAGNPVETTFSLSIRDAATAPVTAYQDNMLTNLLLSSEVKGYIENPMQYFTDNSRVTRTKLDLLMMVQGWRRYSWQQMAGVKPFEIKHFVEEGLPLWGQVKTLVGNKPRGNVDILFWMKNNKGGEIHGKGHTDEKGNFYCTLPDSVDITGRWLLNVSVSEKGKQKHSQILMNRHFSPKNRSYTYWDTAVRDSITVFAEEEDSLHKPSIMETQSLREVQVKRKLWRESMKPDIIYDVDKDINERLDKGEFIPNVVADYLIYNNPLITRSGEGKCSFDANGDPILASPEEEMYPTIYYCNKAIAFRLLCQKEDRAKFKHIHLPMIGIENVKRIKLYTKEGVRKLIHALPESDLDEFEKNSATSVNILVVVELYDDVYNSYRKGIRQTYYEGYSRMQEFYIPLSYDAAIGNLNYQRTLYWNPDVKTDSKGKANIRLYNNGTCRRMDVSAEGIGQTGKSVLNINRYEKE